MLTNQISTSNFKGKIFYGKKMTKPMIDYANKILDVAVDGITARERVKEASYDLYIKKAGTKKAVHPKIYFSSYYKCLGDDYKHYRCSPDVRLDSGKVSGAKELNLFLDRFEYNKGLFKDSYNTFWEKILAFWNF